MQCSDFSLNLSLSAWLEPIAAWFRSFGIPEAIVHWGHPLMMAIVVFVMGSYVGLSGWRGRAVADLQAAAKSRRDHRQLAPLMFVFIAVGATGGILSLVMQRQPLTSPHFWTAAGVLILLSLNAVIAAIGFGKDKAVLRTIHAYSGSLALCLLFLHALLGLKLGLAI